MSHEIEEFQKIFKAHLNKANPKIKPMLLQVADGRKINLELQTWWQDWSDIIFEEWRRKRKITL